jgi:HK97 family phage prohead protease
MNRINLTTEDVFEKQNQKMRIITEGIDLNDRFKDNPIMLFEHNPEKILGKWVDILVENNKISAIPDFDEDEFSVDIANKVKRGSLKSASIGIKPTDYYMDGDVLIINKSILLEASIVGIPANKKAKIEEMSLDFVLLSNIGKEIDLEKYIETIKNKKVNNMKKEKEEKVNDNELESLQLSISEKDKELEELKADKVELNLKLNDRDKKIEEFNKSFNELNLSIENKDKEIESLNEIISSMKKEKLDILLNNAIEQGKISNEAKDDFMELSYEKVESILSKINPTNISLSETLEKNARKEDNKTYDWYVKNDKKGLIKLSKENPIFYKQLEKDYINKLNK